MNSLVSIKKLVAQHKPILKSKFNVKEIALFGSFVREENTKTSDVDILVDFSKAISFFQFIELEQYLKKIVGRKVDLVSKGALKPIIGKYILKEAVPL